MIWDHARCSMCHISSKHMFLVTYLHTGTQNLLTINIIVFMEITIYIACETSEYDYDESHFGLLQSIHTTVGLQVYVYVNQTSSL